MVSGLGMPKFVPALKRLAFAIPRYRPDVGTSATRREGPIAQLSRTVPKPPMSTNSIGPSPRPMSRKVIQNIGTTAGSLVAVYLRVRTIWIRDE